MGIKEKEVKKPLDKLEITQPFGVRPEYYGLGGHGGVDFRTKLNNPKNSDWNNKRGWQPVYAVESGRCVVSYTKTGYGTYIDLTTDKGHLYRYAHLKNARANETSQTIGNQLVFSAKEGDIIGITDNTGNSTGAHLHFGYKPAGLNVWVDPMPLFQEPIEPKIWDVLYVGQNQPDMKAFEENVRKYTNGGLIIRSRSLPDQIQVTSGMPVYEQNRDFLNIFNLNGIKSVFIFYPSNPTSTFFSASYYPEKNVSFVTCPLPGTPETYTHEFLHLFRKWVNSNHLAFIEDVEYYPPNWRFEEQYNQLIPVLPKL